MHQETPRRYFVTKLYRSDTAHKSPDDRGMAVNRDKRAIARRILEGFVSGTVTNREIDEDFPTDRDDPALAAIWERVWFFWDDFRTHTLTEGGRPGEEERRAVLKRCVAFLDSDLEYEWPKVKRGSFAAF